MKQEKLHHFIESVNSEEDWEDCVSSGMEIREEHDKNQWLLGDLTDKVYQKWGSDGVTAYAITIMVQKTTIRRYMDVAVKIPVSLREKYSILSWSHFRVASSRENVEEALQLASDNNWSVENMANQLKKLDGKPVPPLSKLKIVECPFCRRAIIQGDKDLICANYNDCTNNIKNHVSKA